MSSLSMEMENLWIPLGERFVLNDSALRAGWKRAETAHFRIRAQLRTDEICLLGTLDGAPADYIDIGIQACGQAVMAIITTPIERCAMS